MGAIEEDVLLNPDYWDSVSWKARLRLGSRHMQSVVAQGVPSLSNIWGSSSTRCLPPSIRRSPREALDSKVKLELMEGHAATAFAPRSKRSCLRLSPSHCVRPVRPLDPRSFSA